MKVFSCLLALLVALTFFGCNNQKQTDQNKKEPIASKSGELVFGDKKVTYFIEGEGIPCLICADGTIQANCLSEKLKKNFQFIFTEPRHAVYYGEPKDYSDISMDTVIDDIEILRKKLEYPKIYVLGHSVCGLIAMEYGRKYPQNTSGVIVIDTPPHFHNDYMDIVSRNWETNASEERKKVYEGNNERLKKMDLDSLPEIERTFLQSKALIPMTWYDPLYDISSAFRGFRENTNGWNHFYTVLRDLDITRSEINVPIFLSLASYDFMVPQSLWDDYIDKFPTLTVKRFKKSGHYPHVEEQKLFDDQLLGWIKASSRENGS
jgi:proline iminopeptidase